MNQYSLLLHLRELSILIHNTKILSLDISKIDLIIPNAHIKAINLKQEEIILFANEHYPRVLITARFYFMRALRLRDIKSWSKEHIHLCEGLQYIIDDIDDFNMMTHELPGCSRRKLLFSIEIFMIVVLRNCYAYSLLHF